MNFLEKRQSGGQSVWDFMSEVERMFDSTLAPTQVARRDRRFEPRIDVRETVDNYLISADLPGIPRNQVKIECHQGRLMISGERSEEVTKDEDHLHRVERSFGRFERSFQLPSDANEEQIQARYEDGVLEVLVPKTKASKPKTINIEGEKKGLFSKLIGSEKKADRDDRTDH